MAFVKLVVVIRKPSKHGEIKIVNFPYLNVNLTRSATISNLRVQFIAGSFFQLQINHTMKPTIKENKHPTISLFQIAAQIEDELKPATALQGKPTSINKSFAELVLSPRKLEMALANAKKENAVFTASQRESVTNTTKLLKRRVTNKKGTQHKTNPSQRTYSRRPMPV